MYAISVSIFFGVIGVFLTFIYDTITNIVFGLVNGLSIWVALIVGFVSFGLIHMISNGIFFGIGVVPTIKAIKKLIGGEKAVILKK